VVGILVRIIRWWALLGGLLLVAVVLMTTYSAAAGFLVSKPFPGDFELTEMGVAIAAFSFLPYCQVTFSNVSADIFTARAGPGLITLFSRFGSLLAFLFACLLLWRTWAGMRDYQTYLEVTAILQIPIWYAFVPAMVSLALLAVAAVITFIYPDNSPDSPLSTA
jgi:TRAP-type C4-dicarboxylate transport system permease small subunit